MKILVLGADGYLGWPMSIDLSLDKHELLLIDNYAKRSIMNKNNRTPLVLNRKIESITSIITILIIVMFIGSYYFLQYRKIFLLRLLC